MFSVHPPSLRPSSSPSPAAGLTSGRAVLRELELAEQAASDRLIAELAGLPPSLAQLFASIAASEATHVEYLRAARRSPMTSASGTAGRDNGSQQVIAALQDALAAEQAASYGYGVVGAHLPQGSAEQGTATTDWVAHMRARDEPDRDDQRARRAACPGRGRLPATRASPDGRGGYGARRPT